jgi:hypothetical protein
VPIKVQSGTIARAGTKSDRMIDKKAVAKITFKNDLFLTSILVILVVFISINPIFCRFAYINI